MSPLKDPIVLPFKDYTASAKTAVRNTKNLSDQLYSTTINRILNAQFVNLMRTKITGADNISWLVIHCCFVNADIY